jgi:Glu-tRNA(Gln) amidotransferase subunit E-like FAD-binding protein
LKKEKLRDDQIKFLLKHNRIFSLYKSLVLNYQNSAIAAKLLLDIPKKLSKSGEDLKKFYEILNEENLSLVLENFVKGDLQVEDFELILRRLFEGKEILEAVKIERVNFDKIKSEIIKLIEEKPGLNPNAYMGVLMKKFGGKVSPAEMMKLIKEFLS